jgi:hypothetical protein
MSKFGVGGEQCGILFGTHPPTYGTLWQSGGEYWQLLLMRFIIMKDERSSQNNNQLRLTQISVI